MSLKIPAEFTGLEKSAEIAAKKAGRNLKINLGTSARSVDALAQPLGRITGKADEFTKSMEAANARVLAFGASVGVLTAVTQAFKDIVTVTIQVEKQMASINAILGASSGELSKFKKEIFDVARNTEQSFDTVSTAALELSRQGLSATEVVKRLNDSLILSRLSGQSAADAVAGLTSAINGFKKAGITSSEVVNKFSEAAKSAAVSERDLAEAFKRAGAVAGQAGVSFDELVGIVSAVQEKTSRGGAVIGNSFKTIFTRIQSLDKLKTMQELGVQVTDTSGNILSATQLIKNLAGTLENFPDARRLQIAENLVGKFQVAPFISILEDYNDETSKAIKITEISSRATTAAYERNEALNKTLSAAINEVTVNLSQLGDMLGKIGVTDSLKNVLGFFNSMVEGLKGLLDEETGSNIAKGLVKGIGNVISGPGLAIFAAVIGKLTLDLVKFGTGSIKTFFGINRAAKEQATLQGQIASTLLNNSGIQKEILRIENSQLSAEQKKAAQTKFFTTALNEQLAVMQRMQSIAARVAPGVRAGTMRGRGAGGYIPNFAGGSVVGSEQADINRGVGGAPPSARPVTIPNFNFGGGQRGTMVANTSEFIVPNFGGGSAIFNQNMAASMGLPPGAKRVGAAGGYIPNFARVKSIEGHLKSLKGQSSTVVDKAALYKGADPNLSNKALAARQIQQKRTGNVFDADKRGYALLTMRGTGSPAKFTHKFKDPFMGFNSFSGTAYSIRKDGREMGKYSKMTQLEEKLDNSLARAANKVVTSVAPLETMPRAPITASNIDQLIADEGGAGALEAVKGALFESITNAVIGGVKNDSRGRLDIAFNRTNTEPLSAIFGINKRYKFGDYKASIASKDKFVRQAIQHSGAKAASGYIPNYAGPLESAVMREASAGVPINQIRINQKGTLRNSANPMGLAVTNTRDEPTGAIPNFIAGAGMGLGKKPSPQLEKPTRDLLGTIFAVQMGMSLLTGATSDAESSVGKMTNRISNFLSTITTGALATVALKDFGKSLSDTKPKLGGFLSTLGVIGGALVGVGATVKFFDDIINDASGVTDANTNALLLLKDAASKAAFSLDKLSGLERKSLQGDVDTVVQMGPSLGFNRGGVINPMGGISGNMRIGEKLDDATFSGMLMDARSAGISFGRIKKMFDAAAPDAKMNTKEEIDAFAKAMNEAMLATAGAPRMMGNLDQIIKKGMMDEMTKGKEGVFTRGVRGRLVSEGVDDKFIQDKLIRATIEEFEEFRMGVARDLIKQSKDDKKLIPRVRATSMIQSAIGAANLSAAGLSQAEKDKRLIEAGLKDPRNLGSVNRAINAQQFGEDARIKMLETLPKIIDKMGEIVLNEEGLKVAIQSIMKGDIRGMDDKEIMRLSTLISTQGGLREGQALDIATQLEKERQTLEVRLASANTLSDINEELKEGSSITEAILQRNKALATLRGGTLDFKAETALTPFDRFRALAEKERVKAVSETISTDAQRQALLTENLQNTLISASETFAQNISDGLVDAIVQGKSLKDTLVSAATDFFTMMSKAYMQQAVNSIVGGGTGTNILSTIFGMNRNATGGMITGGSGTKDDVPALLTGGEFVMRKSAVQKYGSNFMSSLNQGSVPKFANGGMFIPGTYGQGAISGKQNLLNFATQTGTSGAFDRFGGGAGFASLALAPESLSLTNLGRSLSPAFKRTQGAKADAFDLYVQQLNADKQRKEQERALAQAKKDRTRGLFASLGLAAGMSFLSGGGFKKLGGLFGGRKSAGGAAVGRIDTHAATPFAGNQIAPPGSTFIEPALPSFFEGGRAADPTLLLSGDDIPVYDFQHRRPMGGMIPYMAGGGGVPYAAGVDTVPAMLSGGEFVMNAGATQRIGAGNLEALNAGGSVGGGSSTTITKGDTNISIVVNSDGGEKENKSGSTDEQDQNLAVKLKDAVRDVLSQEKRLGGMLRV